MWVRETGAEAEREGESNKGQYVYQCENDLIEIEMRLIVVVNCENTSGLNFLIKSFAILITHQSNY